MKPDEAAEYLGVAIGTLRNWTSARYVPFAKRGGVVRYHRDRLDEYLLAKSCRGRGHIQELSGSERDHSSQRGPNCNWLTARINKCLITM